MRNLSYNNLRVSVKRETMLDYMSRMEHYGEI